MNEKDDFCVEEMMEETTELFPTHLDSDLFRRFRPNFSDEEYYLLKHKGSVYILLKKVGSFLVDDPQSSTQGENDEKN